MGLEAHLKPTVSLRGSKAGEAQWMVGKLGSFQGAEEKGSLSSDTVAIIEKGRKSKSNTRFRVHFCMSACKTSMSKRQATKD